jgi:hypothetical protein
MSTSAIKYNCMLKEYYKSSFLVLVVICVCCNNTIKSDTSLSA